MTTTTKPQIHHQKPERLQNDAVRVFDAAAWTGQAVAHQGDLTIVRLDAMPKSAEPRKSPQMAIGSTMGARHVLRRNESFDCNPSEVAKAIERQYGVTIGTQYIGPVFRGPDVLEHPEHGDHDYQAECVNVVIYQRSLDAEEREQRVRD